MCSVRSVVLTGVPLLFACRSCGLSIENPGAAAKWIFIDPSATAESGPSRPRMILDYDDGDECWHRLSLLGRKVLHPAMTDVDALGKQRGFSTVVLICSACIDLKAATSIERVACYCLHAHPRIMTLRTTAIELRKIQY